MLLPLHYQLFKFHCKDMKRQRIRELLAVIYTFVLMLLICDLLTIYVQRHHQLILLTAFFQDQCKYVREGVTVHQ